MTMYAVIRSGGAQHRVSEGEVLKLQKIEGAEPGAQMEFDQILVVQQDDKTMLVGEPTVANAKVVATVLEQGRHKKIRVFKKKRRKHYRRTRGHRQPFTAIRIDRIVAG